MLRVAPHAGLLFVPPDATIALLIGGALHSGDHLHPNDAGYKPMGETVDPTVKGRMGTCR